MNKPKKIDIENSRMVGAYVPLPSLEYLYLYAYANNINKSELFRGLITRWVQEKQGTIPQSYLEEKITNQLQAAWDLAKLGQADWSNFKREQCVNLKSYGIPEKKVMLIIDGIKQ